MGCVSFRDVAYGNHFYIVCAHVLSNCHAAGIFAKVRPSTPTIQRFYSLPGRAGLSNTNTYSFVAWKIQLLHLL